MMIQRTSAMTLQSYWRISQEIFLMINKYNKIPLHCSIKQTANVLQTENTADSKHSVPKHTTPLLVKSISRLENWISIIWQFNKSLDTPVTCWLCNKECLFLSSTADLDKTDLSFHQQLEIYKWNIWAFGLQAWFCLSGNNLYFFSWNWWIPL